MNSADHAKKLDDEEKLVHRTLDRAMPKNTVVVPAAGVSVIRFTADNPGNNHVLLRLRTAARRFARDVYSRRSKCKRRV